MEETKRIFEILRPVLKLVIGIIALIFIKILMAIGMPSFEEGVPTILTYIDLVGRLTVNTLILFLLLDFGRECKKILNSITEEKYWGDVAFFTMAIITTGLGHWVYKDLFTLILGRYLYIYSLTFLVLAAGFIIIVGLRIYKNLDKMTSIFLEKIKSIPELIKKIER